MRCMQLTTLNVPMGTLTRFKAVVWREFQCTHASGFDCCESNLVSSTHPFPVVAASGKEIVVKDLPIVTLALEQYAIMIHNDNLHCNLQYFHPFLQLEESSVIPRINIKNNKHRKIQCNYAPFYKHKVQQNSCSEV